MKFASIGAFVGHLAKTAHEMKEREEHAVERALVVIEKDAKARLGEYQPATGPFPGWPSLADSTQADRERQGYAGDEPLLRDGTLQRAIVHEAHGPRGTVGVKDGGTEPGGDASVGQVAAYMENGTAKAPPRPFMGPAGYAKGAEAAQAAGEELVSVLVGHRVHLPLPKAK